MEIRVAYCATHDRPVRVVPKEGASVGVADADPSDLVCMEHGQSCTGAMCPVFDVPSEDMKERLADFRASLDEE